MKELIVRGISGVLYITIIVFAMFASREWFLVLFFLLGVLTLHEFQKLVHLKSYFSYLIFAGLFYFFGYQVIDTNPIYLYAILVLFVNLFLLKDLLVTSKIPMFEKKKYITLIFYIIAGFVFLALIPFRNGIFSPEIIVGIFILIWVNDSFAYLIGKNFGKHKLLERISPKKTREGFLGGFFATLIAGFFIFKYEKNLGLGIWISLAIIVSILGTCGDLIQSKFKRQAGVKDSGTLIPGHGGIYDRLDSVVYVSPFIYSFLEIVAYVS
ncbi:MAG: phosphatidate cytidylyltransferase [Flavobacteriaceae bacterium]|nr:phosphatidate cytidylyltransferase [Flavobacteriaceae bacterium]